MSGGTGGTPPDPTDLDPTTPDPATLDPTTPDPADPAALLAALVRCPSVTPDEGGALDLLERVLRPLGFEVHRPVFSAPGTPDVENLFATRAGSGPHLAFAGHTDVVPPGDAGAWRHPPFAAAVEDGTLYGRGAEDMKGGVAAFVAAVARALRDGTLRGPVSLVITGDEEGPAVNGTRPLLEWAAARGHRFDACVVGEPTNPEAIGDAIKVGRRGSVTGELTVEGRQGHAAYPHRADNPVRGMAVLLDALLREPLDAGTDRFEPTNLEVTSVDVGNSATNVIPGTARALFNVRHNDTWTDATLRAEIERRLRTAAEAPSPLRKADGPIRWRVGWREPSSPCFLTRDEALIGTLAAAVEAETGRRPALSTGGGTSDARFIKDHCPVVEFGLVGRSMHQVDEHVPLHELDALTAIYARFLAAFGAR